MQGQTPLTSKLLKPVLIDAQTGQITAKRDLPWYVTTLLVSQPLHFGDYGGLPLIGLLIAGIILWWPGAKSILQSLKVNWDGGTRRINYDMHKSGGAIAALVLLPVAITGAAMLFYEPVERTVNWLTASVPAAAPPVSSIPAASVIPPPLDTFLRNADQVMPGAKTIYVYFPTTPGDVITVRKKFEQEIHPNGARNFVYLDQYSGAVLGVSNTRRGSLGPRILNTLYPIHIGSLGIAETMMRLLWLTTGLVLAMLFVTGFIVWWTHRRQRSARSC